MSVCLPSHPSSIWAPHNLVAFAEYGVRARACVCVCMCTCVSLSVIIAAPLTRFGCTIGDSEPLAHPLTSSLAPVTHSLAPDCSLHTARFARLLTHSLPSSWDNGKFLSNFQCVVNHSGRTMKSTHRVLGHSLVRSLVHSHCTFIHFLRSRAHRKEVLSMN